jgi:hypothetical protein
MRPKRRPRNRWKDEMLNDLKELNLKNWTYFLKTGNSAAAAEEEEEEEITYMGWEVKLYIC